MASTRVIIFPLSTTLLVSSKVSIYIGHFCNICKNVFFHFGSVLYFSVLTMPLICLISTFLLFIGVKVRELRTLNSNEWLFLAVFTNRDRFFIKKKHLA